MRRAELRTLSSFFAVRFPDAGSRQRIALHAGIQRREPFEMHSEDAWYDVLDQALSRGTLPRLARAAARLCPHDSTVQRMTHILDGAVSIGQVAPIAVMAFVANSL